VNPPISMSNVHYNAAIYPQPKIIITVFTERVGIEHTHLAA